MVDTRVPIEAVTGGAPITDVQPTGPGHNEEGMMQLIMALLQIPFFRNLILQQLAAQGSVPPEAPPVPPNVGQKTFAEKLAELRARGG